jgi:hypothetical protein
MFLGFQPPLRGDGKGMKSLDQSVQRSIGSESANLDVFRLREIICESVQTECVRSLGSTLRAIVLTGSLARDEASFVREGDIWTCAGDAEFLVVLNPNVTAARGMTIHAIQKSIENDLSQKGIFCRIGLGRVHPSYFRRLPPHIFSYELRHCGLIIAGDDRILGTIPDFSVEELSREDAWRLLCNRLIEQLTCIDDFSNERIGPSRRLEYLTIKLYLDMATSYLVFVGAYEPTYRGRAQSLRELVLQSKSDGIAPFLMSDFADRVTQCTEWKLSGGRGPSILMPAYWQEAICYAHKLWRWEIVRMTGAAADLSTSALWDQIAGKLKIAEKIRGWASTARRSGVKNAHHWWRWARLVPHATPRYMIYRVGTELAFSLPLLVGDTGLPTSDQDWAKMGSLLPVSERITQASANNWQYLARQVLSNYRDFVACTRA